MQAPFPYFGGKSRIAGEVWAHLGDVPNFVEPFFGSGAVLLARPDAHQWWDRIETANDINGYVANFWRAVRADPSAVAHYADWPVNENDLHARHAWLVQQCDALPPLLEGDPDYYDAQIAGWWVWGMASWIGGGFCSGEGPWVQRDGALVKDGGRGVKRQLPVLGNYGQGINRKLPQGTSPDTVCADWSEHLRGVMERLQNRLRRVRVCCGDWSRVCGPSPTEKLGLTGIFLDPPYSSGTGRDMDLYGHTDDGLVAHAVREWALARGDNPLYRIALCGYRGEHDDLEDAGWEAFEWKAAGGYANLGDGANHNGEREVVWFSPHCLKPARQMTFAMEME